VAFLKEICKYLSENHASHEAEPEKKEGNLPFLITLLDLN